MSIIVKVGSLPGSINEFALNDGATVKDALDMAGLSSSGFSLTVNSSPATESTRLNNGAVVLLTKNIKGN